MASLWLSLREGVTVERSGYAGVAVTGRDVRLLLNPEAPTLADALLRLAPPGWDEDGVADAILEAAGPDTLAAWYYAVNRLARRGLLCRSVESGERRLASMISITSSPVAMDRASPLPAGKRYRLSRFAFLRREGDFMLLESPASGMRILVHDPVVAAIVAGLSTFATPAELCARCPGLSPDAVNLLVGLIADAGMVEDEAGEPAALAPWEFHDLLFHARSRRGRTDADWGATFRLAGRIDPPPPVRPVPPGDPRPLFRPDLERLAAEDPPLAHVVETRSSAREYGDRPIDARQLGEFLFRVARVRSEREETWTTPAGPIPVATAARPYPSGGALYELEFYAVVAACQGIEPGLYYYEPRGHSLIPCRAPSPEVEGLLHDAAASAGIARDSVQVLIVLTARLPRIAWKYASIAYALVLKHVGVVDHAMYLAATAMGLAPCALGSGDSDLFDRAAGIAYYDETSVGEFLLGSRKGT